MLISSIKIYLNCQAGNLDNANWLEDIAELSKGVTKEFSEDIINFTKEIVKWIMQRMK